MNSELRVESATPADADQLRAWRNEPAVRAASFSTDAVGADEHREWLAHRLASPDCLVLMVLQADEPVGTVRLDREGETSEIHIALGAAARGRGLAAPALRLACALAREHWGLRSVDARIKADNAPSIRAFRSAGFVEVDRADGVVRLRLLTGHQ